MKGLMYEIAGGFINKYFNYADPNNITRVYNNITRLYNNIRDRVVKLCPPASPYIKKSFEWILTLSYITATTWSQK